MGRPVLSWQQGWAVSTTQRLLVSRVSARKTWGYGGLHQSFRSLPRPKYVCHSWFLWQKVRRGHCVTLEGCFGEDPRLSELPVPWYICQRKLQAWTKADSWERLPVLPLFSDLFVSFWHFLLYWFFAWVFRFFVFVLLGVLVCLFV